MPYKSKRKKTKYNREYYKIHRIKMMLYQQNYYREHKEEVGKQHKEYNDNHKEERKEYRDNHKEKLQEYDRKKYKEFKPLYNNLKINDCGICGSNKYLEFHHVNPVDKLFNISEGCSRSNESLLNELNKCILLCTKCHNEIHVKEKAEN